MMLQRIGVAELIYKALLVCKTCNSNPFRCFPLPVSLVACPQCPKLH